MRFSHLFSLCASLFVFSGCFFSSPQTYHDTVLEHAQNSASSMEDFIAEYLQFSEEKMNEEQYVQSVQELRNTLKTTIAKVEKMGGYRGDETLNTNLLAFLNTA